MARDSDVVAALARSDELVAHRGEAVRAPLLAWLRALDAAPG